ncbi:helix-turn-helix transcriptional regulator [Actinomadura fulvescens]|uniref:Helix-turn-helix transcriptional regulator n=1 Tax=Actinomadura fulvescens TaxID=46160 RepID=A0ABN3P8U3_9ACTN
MPRRSGALNPSSSPLDLFGSEVRVRREVLGLTLDQLGARAGYTGSYVGAVERAREMPLRKFAVQVDGALDAQGAIVRLWDGLLKDGIYPSWFNWPEYEEQAVLLRSFQVALIDGLLQTEAYATHLLYGDKAAIAARMGRQKILARDDPPPPMLVCLLDEAALYRDVGGPDVMREQYDHLLTVASEEVNIHVVPSMRHRGVNGSFVLATLEDRSEVAYVETAVRGITTGEPMDLRTASERFEAIRSLALPVDQSLERIERIKAEKWT